MNYLNLFVFFTSIISIIKCFTDEIKNKIDIINIIFSFISLFLSSIPLYYAYFDLLIFKKALITKWYYETLDSIRGIDVDNNFNEIIDDIYNMNQCIFKIFNYDKDIYPMRIMKFYEYNLKENNKIYYSKDGKINILNGNKNVFIYTNGLLCNHYLNYYEKLENIIKSDNIYLNMLKNKGYSESDIFETYNKEFKINNLKNYYDEDLFQCYGNNVDNMYYSEHIFSSEKYRFMLNKRDLKSIDNDIQRHFYKNSNVFYKLNITNNNYNFEEDQWYNDIIYGLTIIKNMYF